MGLLEKNVSKNMPRDKKIWRYMALDKFIDLLNTKQLFFTSIGSYASTDPFEGLTPRVMLEAMRDLHAMTQSKMRENAYRIQDHFFNMQPGIPRDIENEKRREFDVISNDIDKMHLSFEKIFFRILKSTVVNCWHQNESESEAMWRLYSENNKGIAIQTSVGNLIDSINDERIYFSEVKYIDFHDKKLTKKDCMVNGEFGPLLKREAFRHEQEARLYLQPQVDYVNVSDENFKCPPERVDVDTKKLISKVYISPYATEPYLSSVRFLTDHFGIDRDNVIQSSLLSPDNELLRMY